MLTPKQKRIFEYIRKYIKTKDYAPSFKEIGEYFKLTKSTIHQHVEILKRKGYLEKRDNQARAIEIIEERKSFGLRKIPLVGIITAGQPIEAIETLDENILIPKDEIGRFGNYYALQVRG